LRKVWMEHRRRDGRQNWLMLSPNIATQTFLVPKRGAVQATDHKTHDLYLFQEFDVDAMVSASTWVFQYSEVPDDAVLVFKLFPHSA